MHIIILFDDQEHFYCSTFIMLYTLIVTFLPILSLSLMAIMAWIQDKAKFHSRHFSFATAF